MTRARSSAIGWPRKREKHARAFSRNTLRPHAASVAVNQAAHGCQPDARSFEFVRRVQPRESVEEMPGFGRVESYPVVAHEEHGVGGIAGHYAHLDLRRLFPAREF